MSILGDAAATAQGAAQAVMKKAIELAPDSWLPGGKPDPLMHHKHGLIGAPISRIDGPLKVQGRAKFAAEFHQPGLAYAAVAFSTIPKGRLTALDTAAAESAPGVILVMTHRNAPRMKNMPLFGTAGKACGGDSLPILQNDEIHWNGQPIAVVLAETQEQAEHAKSLVHASYAPEPALTNFAGSQGTRAPSPARSWALRSNSTSATPRPNSQNPQSPSTRPTKPRATATTRSSRTAVNPLLDGDNLQVHDASQAVVHTAWSHRRGLRSRRSPGACHLALCRRRLRFAKTPLAAPHARPPPPPASPATPGAPRACRAEGVYRIVGGRTETEQRVAIGARTDGTFDRPHPHRRRRHDGPQQRARTLRPAHPRA